MNRRTLQIAARGLMKVADFHWPLAVLAVAMGAGGCASSHPSPLLIEHRLSPSPLPSEGRGIKGEGSIIPLVSVRQPTSEDGIRLKLVTYNIWGLPSWMTGARSGRYPKIAQELERLNPDVIFLQEAWTANARKSAPADGHWSVARAAGQHTFFQQNGLVTLSRFPIIGGRFYPFSRSAFPDRFVNKGVLKVTVLLPTEQVVNFWNVHLQDGGSPAIRLSQVRELLSHMQAAEDGQIADVVGGDFNCTPDSSLYRELASSVGPSVQRLGGIAPFVTWDGLSAKPGAGQTLDYIFIRSRGLFQDLQAAPHVAFTAASRAQRLSDHFGIESTVHLSPRPILAGAVGPLDEVSNFKSQISNSSVAGQAFAGFAGGE
jgi:endonuclease/exonuclease/phosphatase family metal-dependent hydrolase